MEQLRPGQMLGPYRIINQVGQGGMAAVYKAYQPAMDRNVAIKVLPGQLAESQEFVKRFKQEARIIARLEHAHILPVFDYGESDNIAYFVMRYLEAGTLKNKMETGPLSMREVDRIFTQLADALGYAHNQGVIHRDLKPANALIDSQGDLFLTDFGIAKILESASPGLTQTDAIMGTPAYISPEQAQSSKVDQRSDIYSLGIILYEMITGRVPFTADTPLAVILKHVSDPLPLPSTINPDIPENIEQVILKALAKNPSDRFTNTADFLAAWKHALESKDSPPKRFDTPTVISSPSLTPPVSETVVTQDSPAAVSSTYTNSKPGRSNRWAVGCVVGACLLLATAGTGILFANRQNLPFTNKATNIPSIEETIPVSGDVMTQNFQTEIGDEIANGEPDSGAGWIEAPGSKDIYAFSAEPGQKIYVHIIEPPTTVEIVNFYMIDDLGSNVFSSCLQCGDPGLITLDRGGRYTVIVGNDDPQGAGYGMYRFKLWAVAPPDEFSIELDQEISRDEPGAGAGFIENPGSSDVYTFAAEPGQNLYFQVMQMPQTSEIINWRVEDEVGSVIFNTCLQCGEPGVLTLERGGLYTIIVGSQYSHGTGAYAIKAWSVPAPDVFEVSVGDTISKDDPGTGAGFIESPGVLDIYTFTAIAGQTVSFTVVQLPNIADIIYWRLEDELGNELFNTCLACGDPGTITLDHGGTYTITVGSNTSPGLGAYAVQLSTP